MSTYYLINSVRLGTQRLSPGALINSAFDDVAAIQANGGLLIASSDATIATAATIAQQLVVRGNFNEAAGVMLAAATKSSAGDDLALDLASTDAGKGGALVAIRDAALRFAGADTEAVTAELGGRIGAEVADTTALQAVAAATRSSSQIVVKLDTNDLWIFDANSAVGADAWTIVPGAGTGRWVRPWPSLADLASTATGLGASLIGVDATNNNLEVALAAVKATADAGIGVVKRTVTVGHADLTDAVNGEAQSINIGATLPANARIAYVDPHDYTPFTGGGAVSVDLNIGTSGDLDAIVAACDVLSAAVDGGPSTLTRGIRPNKLFATIGAQLLATFTPDGAHNLNDLTAGSIILDVWYFVGA